MRSRPRVTSHRHSDDADRVDVPCVDIPGMDSRPALRPFLSAAYLHR
ncbi:hypothetical protein HDA40_002062 [Hamadaea flava]|nr:hypothetical protein [Hamadaea flava]